MSEIWEKVELKQTSRRVGEPIASIGQGRLALNADACDLISNIYDYEWVQLTQAREGGRITKIGLEFTNKNENGKLRALRRKYKGKYVEGLNINSKQLVKKYFGETKETSTARFAVKKINDKTLAIDISKEI